MLARSHLFLPFTEPHKRCEYRPGRDSAKNMLDFLLPQKKPRDKQIQRVVYQRKEVLARDFLFPSILSSFQPILMAGGAPLTKKEPRIESGQR